MSSTLPRKSSTLATGSCACPPIAAPRITTAAAMAPNRRDIDPTSIGDRDVFEGRRKRRGKRDFLHLFRRRRKLSVPGIAGAFGHGRVVVGTGERNLPAVAQDQIFLAAARHVELVVGNPHQDALRLLASIAQTHADRQHPGFALALHDLGHNTGVAIDVLRLGQSGRRLRRGRRYAAGYPENSEHEQQRENRNRRQNPSCIWPSHRLLPPWRRERDRFRQGFYLPSELTESDPVFVWMPGRAIRGGR